MDRDHNLGTQYISLGLICVLSKNVFKSISAIENSENTSFSKLSRPSIKYWWQTMREEAEK